MLSTKQAQIFRSYNNKAKALGFAHVKEAGALAIECMNAIKNCAVELAPHAAAKAARVVKPQMTRAERVLAAHKARTVNVSVVTETEVVKPQSAMTVAEASVVAATEAKKAAKANSKAARKAAREQAKANSKAAKAKRAAVKAQMVKVDEVKVEVHPVQELLNVAEAAVKAYEAAPSRKTKAAAAIAITNAERAMTPKAEVKQPSQLEVFLGHVNKCVNAYANNPNESTQAQAQEAVAHLQNIIA